MSNKIGTAVVLSFLFVAGASTVACTHQSVVPRPLAAARAEVARAQNGPAGRLQPVAVDGAQAALAEAEAAYKTSNDDAELRAIYAQRKAQLAESLASTEMARQRKHDAIAERTVLLQEQLAEARVIAERNGQIPPATGVAEMQNQPAPAPSSTSPRAPGSTPQGGPQSDAPPKAR